MSTMLNLQLDSLLTGKLPRSFYLRPTLTVARELLGTYLVRATGRNILAGKIVEVEAYQGEKDPASHAYRGKSKRNEVMFRMGGYLYVYFTYGMHYCCNVVTEEEGLGRAVLLRAIEPVSGTAKMKRNRDFDPGRMNEYQLTNGPAKLCEAFGISRKDNGTDLLGDDLFISRVPGRQSTHSIVRSTRIGISAGTEHRWRFTIRDNPWVSRP